MSLSSKMSVVVAPMQRRFTAPTWPTVQVRLAGTVTVRGQRTVTAAPAVRLYHQVLQRARWAALDGRRRGLALLVRTFVAVGGTLPLVMAEPWERRRGPCSRQRGHDREPWASSTPRAVATSGRRGIVLPLGIPAPWPSRPWALPVCRVPAPTPPVRQHLGQRHKTIAP
jgi:hypothetical protein